MGLLTKERDDSGVFLAAVTAGQRICKNQGVVATLKEYLEDRCTRIHDTKCTCRSMPESYGVDKEIEPIFQ